MKEVLNKRERLELIDLLRKQLLYQTPKPVYYNASDSDPVCVDLRFIFTAHNRILELIHKARGWVMPEKAKKARMAEQKVKIRQVYADGQNFDFSTTTYGELVMMHEELTDVDDPDLQRFRAEIGKVLEDEVVGEARESN